MALVLPLLLILLLGMIDFGKAFNYWIDETHLANEGARWAVVNGKPGGATLQQYIRSQANGELKSGTGSITAPVKVCVAYSKSPPQAGDPVTVSVSATYRWLGYLVKQNAVGVTSGVAGSATMRLEQNPDLAYIPSGPGGTGASCP